MDPVGVLALCCGIGILFLMIHATVLLDRENEILNLRVRLYYSDRNKSRKDKQLLQLRGRMSTQRQTYIRNLNRMQKVFKARLKRSR